MGKSLKISISSMLAIPLFLTQFITMPYISWYNLLRYGTIVIVGLYVGRRIRIVIQKKYFFLNLIALIFSFLTIITSYLNRSRLGDRDPFLASIPFAVAFLFFLFYMEIMAEKKKIKRVIEIFLRTSLVVLLITDILIFVAPSLLTLYGNYFVGTKFEVAYLHILTIILYLSLDLTEKINTYEKILLVILSAWTFFISAYVDCSTGIVGIIVLLLLLLAIKRRELLFLNGKFYCVIQTLCLGFVFFYKFVLNNSTVEYFVVELLGRDITLTSRTRIYEIVPILLTEHNGWMIGMGYGSSYDLGMRLAGFPDTQNGILEWIWQVGIPTTIIMVLMFAVILTIASKYMNQRNRRFLYPLIAGLYLFTILGTVEITITSMYFSLALCIIGVAAGTYRDADKNVGVNRVVSPLSESIRDGENGYYIRTH